MAKKLMRTPMVVAVAAFAGLALAGAIAIAQPTVRPAAVQKAPTAAVAPTAYGFTFDGLITDRIPLEAYKGKVILVVNTATQCGFKAQLGELQTLYTEFAPAGLVIVGVPSGDFLNQEYDDAKKIAEVCRLNYGVSFPMASKSHVKGAEALPFYQWAHATLGDSAVPQWNFHKILIGRDGRPISAFGTRVSPVSPEFKAAIQAALAAHA